MSDVSKLKINNTTYNIKDALALRDAPTDGFEYVRKNGVWTISSGGGGGGGDGIIFNDDTAVIQPGGAYLGNSIEFSNNSAIIRTSEETANGFVKKSGDTITGSLIHETSGEYGLIIRQINDSSVLPSENIYSRGIAFRDKNDNPLGYFRQALSTTGTSSIDFTGQKNVNGTNIYNILSVGVNADGSGHVYLSEPAAWRDALGLSDSDWQTLPHPNPDTFSGTIFYRKIGDVIYLSGWFALASNLSAKSLRTIATLPSGYRPSKLAIGTCYIDSTSISNRTASIVIYTSGDIEIRANDAIANSYNIALYVNAI